MKFLKFHILPVFILLFTLVNCQNVPGGSKMVCYYNSTSFIREGLGKLIINDLEPALQFCTHLVYGWVGINAETNKLESLNPNLDLDQGKGHFRVITSLKRKYPAVKFLLSVGGFQDPTEEDTNKYLTLLESSAARISFINSAHTLVKTYDFDGLDLSWQFPPNKPKKKHSSIGKLWKGFKKIFTGDAILDEKAEEHKEEFVALVRELKNAFRHEGYILSLTVLPNVNSSLFYDVPALINNIDFVNLAAFDFHTPLRYPKEADYPAPLYELNDRHPEHNVNFQVQYWLGLHCPATKINVGVPTYGRVWQMTSDSGLTGHPPVADTEHEAPPGLQSHTSGLYSWPEVCSKLPNPSNAHLKGEDAPVRKVGDPTKRFGSYAYRVADDDGKYGLWIGYEDPDTAGNKAGYVRAKGLGGLALFDLSYDDFRGSCSGDKFPILRAAKFRL
ncbi:chitinase-like protein Idgf4 [Condylostylus longicornis]|uniref:chitinase-like protein Idgf4 n=1 Tax=Condylostylus longicornis TaxID=2530218 RepID=UPI00244E255B|nr:chitinase-like protein Idgf4 [Condylostylus longicornis]